MMERPLGIVIAFVGAAGTAIAALANPLGIGETQVFGWLQIAGVILGAMVTLLGLAMAGVGSVSGADTCRNVEPAAADRGHELVHARPNLNLS